MAESEAGTVAVVTGAGSGIGRATAWRLAGAGHLVVAVDIDEAAAAATARAAAAPGRIVPRQLDVADPAAVAACFDWVAGELGVAEVLVANAGVGGDQPFLEAPPEAVRRTLAVNLEGVAYCGQTAARAMVAAGRRGSIVNTASTYSEVAAPGSAFYCASKAGVRMLTRAMAVELGPLGIRVNAVAPGWIRTGMNPLQDPVRVAELERAIPSGRVGSPDDVAAAIVYLCSADAAYVNGATLYVDGGWSCA